MARSWPMYFSTAPGSLQMFAVERVLAHVYNIGPSKEILMTFWMALFLPFLAPQDSADDLRKEVEKLKKQTLELQERLSLLEQSAVEDAQTIQRLRQVINFLESNGAGEPAPGTRSPAPPPVK